jgi:hypothetical protein
VRPLAPLPGRHAGRVVPEPRRARWVAADALAPLGLCCGSTQTAPSASRMAATLRPSRSTTSATSRSWAVAGRMEVDVTADDQRTHHSPPIVRAWVRKAG